MGIFSSHAPDTWTPNQPLRWPNESLDSVLIRRADAFGYLNWPKKIREHVASRSVLDIGCGPGLHGIGFLAVGATHYCGIDTVIPTEGDVVKNRRAGRKEPFGWTMDQVVKVFPAIELVRGTFDDFPAGKSFGVISMHTVTEHLMNIEQVFASCAALLEPGGKLIFYHHNFYSWNGHHQQPKTINDIDWNDPLKSMFADWGHLSLNLPANHYVNRGLNRIRLDDLKALTEKHFEIAQWEELPSKKLGSERITAAVLARLPQFTERELTVNKVFCVAKCRSRRSL